MATDDEIRQALSEAIAKGVEWAEGPRQVLDLVWGMDALGLTEQLHAIKSTIYRHATSRAATNGSMAAEDLRALCEAWAIVAATP